MSTNVSSHVSIRIRTVAIATLGIALCASSPARSADLATTVDEAYQLRGLSHDPFDLRAADSMAPDEARFLEELFALADEAVLLNSNVALWFATGGARGLHAVDYQGEVEPLLDRLGTLEAPERAKPALDYVAESLHLQRSFWAEWHQANEDGRPFSSQLDDEFAYHEGLHRSQRLLLKAYAELRALFPEAGAELHGAILSHLRAMCPG